MTARLVDSPQMRERLVAAVCQVMGVDRATVFGTRQGQCVPARGVAAYLARQDLGLSFAEVAAWIGVAFPATAAGLVTRFAQRHGLPMVVAVPRRRPPSRPALAEPKAPAPAHVDARPLDGSLEARICGLLERGDALAAVEIADRLDASPAVIGVMLARLKAAGVLVARAAGGVVLWRLAGAEPGSAEDDDPGGGRGPPEIMPVPRSGPNPRAPTIPPRTATPAVAGLIADRILSALADKRALTSQSLATMLDVKELVICRALNELALAGRAAPDPLGEGGRRAQLWRVAEGGE